MEVKLIRFHDWIIDKNDISFVDIHAEREINSEFEMIEHRVVMHLKGEKTLTLRSHNLYDARKELNMLTAESDALHVGSNFDHYLSHQVHLARYAINNLQDKIEKLMKSYKKNVKKKD